MNVPTLTFPLGLFFTVTTGQPYAAACLPQASMQAPLAPWGFISCPFPTGGGGSESVL